MLFFGLMLVCICCTLGDSPGRRRSVEPAACRELSRHHCSVVPAVIGACLLMAGRKMLSPSNVLPVQTVETAKENVEWIMNSK